MKCKLNNAYSIIKNEKDVAFIRELNKYTIRENSEICRRLKKILSSKNGIIKREDLSFDDFLYSKKVLIPSIVVVDKKNESTIDYCLQYTDKISEKEISNAVIVIVGLGGIGQVVMEQLVASGLKKFILIDFDKIVEKNFNRQFLILNDDIGKHKVDAVETNLRNRYDGLEIIKYRIKLIKKEDLNEILDSHKVDFIVGAADHPPNKIQAIILEISKAKKIPCGFASVGLNYSVVGPILTGHESFFFPNDNRKFAFKEILSASASFTNSITGAILAKEIFFFLFRIEKSKIIEKQLIFDFKEYTSTIC